MDEQAVEHEIRSRFPEGAIARVVVLHYGDDPVIEPGRIGIRITIDPSRVSEPGPDALVGFHRAHEEAIKRLAADLPRLVPEYSRLEFTDGGDKSLFMMGFGPADEKPVAVLELTPVMARLGRADLETLDTLITAGIATSRADAVRWALARIRERPAYGELSQRVREISELKSHF